MDQSTIRIRKEQPADAAGVREINLRAFGGEDEADLVDRLRDSCPMAISFVAEMETRLVGHILFTPVGIDTGSETVVGMGLAPMSVIPDLQRQGIGKRLIQSGLAEVRHAGYPFVVVLGHPEYYPRFGFVPAAPCAITCEFNVPEELFMILTFEEDGLTNLRGVAKYRPEFDAFK